MEIRINRTNNSWAVTDDLGGVLEQGVSDSLEHAQRDAEIAAAWIQNKTTYYGG